MLVCMFIHNKVVFDRYRCRKRQHDASKTPTKEGQSPVACEKNHLLSLKMTSPGLVC